MCGNVSPQTKKRRYIQVFFHFLDVTFVNAWALYLKTRLEKMSPLIFKASVACALINAGSLLQSRRGRPSGTPPPAKRRSVTKVPREARISTGYHRPKLTQVKNVNRCHNAACTRRLNTYACSAMWHCALDALQTFIQPRLE